jgi:dual-action HEIGH metallo-peptidase
MKHVRRALAMLFLIGIVSLTGCKKDAKSGTDGISADTLARIAAAGFSTTDVQKVDEGYLVEGDIVLTENDLSSSPSSTTLRIAQTEQYRTTNRLSAPRVITVNANGVGTALLAAVDAAIKRYNDQGLLITFQRVTSAADITIVLVNTGQYIASSGFPDSQGNPYPTVKYAKKYSNYSSGFMTTVIAHEVGHCIGFRHTDYMNRSYSCGIGGNEGDGGVGAIQIPGTPSGPDAASWMLACLSSTTDRPFNTNDIVALDYLFK